MIMKALIVVLLPVAVIFADVSLPPQPPHSTNTSTTTQAPNTTTTTTLAPNTTTTLAPNTTTTLAPNTTTTLAPNTTTTLAPNTTTTLAPNTTTTLAPNTTTTLAPNTTTTLAPNTTTTSTTTPMPNTTTTSPTPTPAPGPNTTTSTSTVAPSPTPVPDPQQGKWTVKDAASNVTCIIADMAVQISVKYQTTDNKTEVAVLDVPKDANATGKCDNATQSLMLQWLHKQDKNHSNMLEMVFRKEVKDKKFVVQNITLQIAVDTDDFPQAPKNVSNIKLFHNGTLFGTTLARSYKCTKQQEVSLFGNSGNSTIGTMKISHVQLEAFHETNTTDFGAVEDCERSTDIVPITVGCALVGLVAVVLIGYLVGRRRSQARGYLSM